MSQVILKEVGNPFPHLVREPFEACTSRQQARPLMLASAVLSLSS